MFFFFVEERETVWRQYMDELGITKTIKYLKAKGLPATRPEQVVDLQNPATLKATATACNYRSGCPHYAGFWLCGHIGSVECRAAGELLPGVAWDHVCAKDYTQCPFYKMPGGMT